MRIIVGCPVKHRDWILPSWFGHVEQAFSVAGVTPEYIFAVDPRDSSTQVIKDECRARGRLLHFVNIVEDQQGERSHRWDKEDRLQHLTLVRNALLREVRRLEPHAFLSLDSDILITPQTVKNLWTTAWEDERLFDAVGGKCYLGAGVDAITWGLYSEEQGLRRQEASGVFVVDVIMAIKFMSPAAFNVDYVYHHKGEDIGWSMACRRAGLTLGWDGRETCKHVMEQFDDRGESMITKVDPRCGF